MRDKLPNGWTSKTLGELFEFKNGFNTDKSMYGKGKKFINIMEVINKQSLYKDDIPGQVDITDDSFSLFSVVKGDVLFNRTSETPDEIGLAAVYLDEQPVTFGGFVIRARPIGNDLDREFCKYCFSIDTVRKEIIKRGQGAIRANIGQSDLSDVFLQIPPRNEQEKIAKILATWDDAIEIEHKKQNCLLRLRAALLNRLILGAKGDLRPLNEIGIVVTGSTPPTKDLENYGNSYPFVSPADLDKCKFLRTSNSGVSEVGWKISRKLPAGAVLFSCIGTIGKMAIASKPLCTNQQINGIIPQRISSEYLYYLLRANTKFISTMAGTQTLPQINKSNFEKIKFVVPIEEYQEMVSKILGGIDVILENSNVKIRILNKQKKGLMQQLLTGKKRVNV